MYTVEKTLEGSWVNYDAGDGLAPIRVYLFRNHVARDPHTAALDYAAWKNKE